MSNRKTLADDRLARLRQAAPEHRNQQYDAWLQVATGAEIRRHWRQWMPAFPAWAQKASNA